jgi:hypothetical protein
MPGRSLYELGNEVRKHYAASDGFKQVSDGHRTYLGGWPSANYGTVHGDMLLTSLLYSNQIVIKDPLYDWFSREQYGNIHKMAARPGYRQEDGSPNVRATRIYLENTLGRLAHLKPLVDRGIVVLIPGEAVVDDQKTAISELETALWQQVAPQIEDYVRNFSPREIPVEDNVRGMFAFVGGERVEQQLKYLQSAIAYFAREFVIAECSGATYTAPFPHEQFLLGQGVGGAIGTSNRVSTALLTSQIPMFSGLTPALVARLHSDDAFGEFRRDLHTVYQHAPTTSADELRAYVHDQDRELIAPKLKSARDAAARGWLGKLGLSLKGASFGIGTGVIIDVAAGTPGLATTLGALGTIGATMLERRKAQEGAQQIWSSLVEHHRDFAGELNGVKEQPSSSGNTWGIPDTPSMEITISEGAIFSDWMAPLPAASDPTVYSEGAYRPCDCGGGRKFKFCCKGISM